MLMQWAATPVHQKPSGGVFSAERLFLVRRRERKDFTSDWQRATATLDELTSDGSIRAPLPPRGGSRRQTACGGSWVAADGLAIRQRKLFQAFPLARVLLQCLWFSNDSSIAELEAMWTLSNLVLRFDLTHLLA